MCSNFIKIILCSNLIKVIFCSYLIKIALCSNLIKLILSVHLIKLMIWMYWVRIIVLYQGSNLLCRIFSLEEILIWFWIRFGLVWLFFKRLCFKLHCLMGRKVVKRSWWVKLILISINTFINWFSTCKCILFSLLLIEYCLF